MSHGEPVADWMKPSLIVSLKFSKSSGRLAPVVSASVGMRCCVTCKLSGRLSASEGGEDAVCMDGSVQASLVILSEEHWEWLTQQCRRDSQTCRALVYRHSCIVFALAWFYQRISLPAAVELESEHSLLSFSLFQSDAQLTLWASKTVYVRDMTGLWSALPLIR